MCHTEMIPASWNSSLLFVYFNEFVTAVLEDAEIKLVLEP